MKGKTRRYAGVLALIGGLDVAQPPDMGAVIQGLAQQFTSIASLLLTSVNSVVIDISRLAYISVLLIGLLLYFTHVERRYGKDLIKGGIILAVLSEFVFPWLNRL
jgi:anti-anti-sigma regulatory factor